MKLAAYEEALKMGKARIARALIPVKVRRAKARADLEIAKIEERIAIYENDLKVHSVKEDLDFDLLISVQNDLALAQRRKAQLEKIVEQMFP